MKSHHYLALIVFCLFVNPVFGAQSTITDSQGKACMGEDKSRKQAEDAALTDAKRNAMEFASTHIRSETEIKNFFLEKDLLSAYAHAEVKLLQEPIKEWYKDPNSGDCVKLRIKAEIIPDAATMQKMAALSSVVEDNPSAPLWVKAWTDKKEYKAGEKIRVYIKGNKPFYARVIYKNASGDMVQILPNPYRADNYFNGATMYEMPTRNDNFELEVSPPFGEESIIVYGSTGPLGEIELQTRGGVYQVTSKAKDVALMTRGIKLVQADGRQKPFEFSETNTPVKTCK